MTMLQRARERFWFIPTVLCLAAMAGAGLLITLDEHLRDVELPGWAEFLVYRVAEGGSRDILGAIATSSLAVAGTTFSITMAVLALTSSSYGPRLVRNFMADRGNQFVLGVYVATFLYSLLVLRSIRAIDDTGVFVPHIAVNVAGLLAVLNVAVLVYFIHHISDSIQIATLSAGVREELLTAVDSLYPARLGKAPGELTRHEDDERAQARPDVEAGGLRPGEGGPEQDVDSILAGLTEPAAVVRADRPGYLEYVREDDLLETAKKHDVHVLLLLKPGEYVLPEGALALVYPAERVADEVLSHVGAAVRIAGSRTPHQDVEFAVQQLTELAVRALSPGTNDPYTAINALDDLTVGLRLLASRPMPSAGRFDSEGTMRVHAPRADPVEVVSTVLDQMRWYAAGAPSVMYASLRLIERVGAQTRNAPMLARLRQQTTLFREAFIRAGHDEHDIREFERRAGEVGETLSRD